MIALRPGQSVTITVNTLGSGLRPSTQLDGQYRVRFNLFANEIGGFFVLPPEQSTSTPFKLLPVGAMQQSLPHTFFPEVAHDLQLSSEQQATS